MQNEVLSNDSQLTNSHSEISIWKKLFNGYLIFSLFLIILPFYFLYDEILNTGLLFKTSILCFSLSLISFHVYLESVNFFNNKILITKNEIFIKNLEILVLKIVKFFGYTFLLVFVISPFIFELGFIGTCIKIITLFFLFIYYCYITNIN